LPVSAETNRRHFLHLISLPDCLAPKIGLVRVGNLSISLAFDCPVIKPDQIVTAAERLDEIPLEPNAGLLLNLEDQLALACGAFIPA
tara:strand:+ start:111 stop:371 length:261 start_codon:yes stop_codon:yes gene_type:complete